MLITPRSMRSWATRCLALELAPHNILVNAICPWVVDTDMATDFVETHAAAGKTKTG